MEGLTNERNKKKNRFEMNCSSIDRKLRLMSFHFQQQGAYMYIRGGLPDEISYIITIKLRTNFSTMLCS